MSVYIAMSLDGFIAKEDHDLSWLNIVHSSSDEDYGYSQFMSSVDTVVMGRKTFDIVSAFPQWPFEGKKVCVLTHRPLETNLLIRTFSGELSALLKTLAQEGAQRVYLDGGLTIQQGLAAGWVDDITVSIIPILLGKGIPLFHQQEDSLRLKFVKAQSFESGLVQVQYLVK